MAVELAKPAGPDPETELLERIAETVYDPLGFVEMAFDWGHGELEGMDGPDVWQREFLTALGNGTLTAETAVQMAVASGHGVGKGLRLDEPVLTPHGWTPIGLISVGDLVATVDGTFTKVTYVSPVRLNPSYRVTLDDGSVVHTDHEHRWLTTTRSERKHNKPGSIRTTPEILESLTFPNGPGDGLNHCLPAMQAIEHPTAALPLEPYVLGVWLGDGSHKGRISTNQHDMDIVAACGHGSVAVKGGAAIFTPPGIAPKLRALGLEGRKSPEKFIPRSYLYGSVSQRIALLQGLLDTDGAVGSSNAITFDTASKDLADGMAELVRSLGGVAKRGGRQGRLNGIDKLWSYRVYVSLPENVSPFRAARKANAYRPHHEHQNKRRTLSRFIASVELMGNAESVCIAVEHASHLYITRDHIVTHNTSLVAWICLWAMSTRPQLAGVVTANTTNQLTGKTWRELSLWHKRLINAHWFKWTATTFYHVDFPETWRLNAIPWSKEKPEAFAGLHAEHVLMIMDEASAIHDSIFDVAQGALTTPGAIWCCFGNPTRNTGYFRETFGRFKHRWSTFQVDSRTAKMANQKQLKQWIDDYGLDSDFVRIRIRGMFPRAGSSQFISSEDVDAAMSRPLVGDDGLPMVSLTPKVIGVDVARFGDDQTVIICREGSTIKWTRKYRAIDTVQTANLTASFINEEHPDATCVDGVGIGAGVIDNLRAQGYKPIEVQSGASPKDDKMYFNLRAEMWGRMREWIRNHGVLPKDDELRSDLTGIEYGFASIGQIQLEKKADMKSRGLSSPDIGDALALTFVREFPSADLMRSMRSRTPAVANGAYASFKTKRRALTGNTPHEEVPRENG